MEQANAQEKPLLHVLCYGDSNTWGIVPGTRQRHAWHVRWPGVLQQRLGPGVRVIEEGLNGRTTLWDDPTRPGRNGREFLLPLLQSHAPLDLVILMLGTNDLQDMHGLRDYEAALGVSVLVDLIRNNPPEPMTAAPPILLVSPPSIVPTRHELGEKFSAAIPKAAGLAQRYERLAAEKDCLFLDAALIAVPSEEDGVHLGAQAHLALGEAIGRVVCDFFRL